MKDFFSKTWVRVVACILVVVGAVALVIGGVKVDDIKNIVVVADGIVMAIAGLVALIGSIVTSKIESK